MPEFFTSVSAKRLRKSIITACRMFLRHAPEVEAAEHIPFGQHDDGICSNGRRIASAHH